MTVLVHGGNIARAAHMYGRPVDDWIDVSTGINVHSYPIPELSAHVWQRLPYPDEQFIAAAFAYYQSRNILLTAGSQPILECLPQALGELGNRQAVLIPDIGYQEHRHAWQGHTQVVDYNGLIDDSEAITKGLAEQDIGHLLVINPNNPTGIRYSVEQIYAWAAQLASKQGFVVVDEAFIDCQPEQSCITPNMPSNVLVIRSFGKFFGLAGIRLGALIAMPTILEYLANQMGIWRVNGPAQAVSTAAFNDRQWQQQMRAQLANQQAQQRQIWQPVLHALGARIQADTALFRSFTMPAELAQEVHQKAAMQGILTRPVDIDGQTSLLRMGNIDITNQSHLQRCNQWLQSLT